MSEIPSGQDRKFNRRTLLKGLGAVAGAVVLKNAGRVPDALEALGSGLNPSEADNRRHETEYNHEQEKKHDFPSAYASLVENTVARFNTRYLAKIAIMPFHDTNVTAIVNEASKYDAPKDPYKENVEILKNVRWGEKTGEREQAVVEKIQKLVEKSGNNRDLADFLKKVGGVYPAHVLALPEKISLGDHLQTDKDTCVLPSGLPEPILATYVLSAGQKYLDSNWQQGAPYIPFEKYKDQLVATTNEMSDLAETYFTLPWEKARTFYYGQPLLRFEGNDQDLEFHTKYYEGYGIKFPPLPVNTSQVERELRYNELVHRIGKEFVERDQKLLRGENTYSSLYSIYCGANQRMEEVLYRLRDILTMPQVNTIGALPSSLSEELKDPYFDHPINRAKMRVWDRITADTSEFSSSARPDEIYQAMHFSYSGSKTPLPTPPGKQSEIPALSSDSPLPNAPEARIQRVVEKLGPDFMRLFSLHEQYTYRYGDKNPMNVFFRRLGAPFDNITGVLREVAAGHDSPELQVAIQRLNAGWNERGGETVEQVNKNIDAMNIVVPKDNGRIPASPENAERMRWFLKNVGKFFPYNVLAMPQQVALFFNGGGLAGHDEITLNFPGTNPYQYEQAVISWLHESTHLLEDAWERVKPYITQERYISYAQFELEQVYNTSEYYFSLPWDQAMTFKTGEPMILLGNGSVPDIIAHGQSIKGSNARI